MPVLIRDFTAIMEKLAPASLAEEWDNVGLQAGSAGSSIDSLLVTLNVNDEVISEAVSRKCGLVLTHHPLIFRPLVTVSEETAPGRLIGRIHGAGLAVFAAHTNLDAAPGGLADSLAGLLGLNGIRPLEPARTEWSKLVVFVPADDLVNVKKALFDAGAGAIGDYRHCSFMVEGTGTFLPLEGAAPAIGEVGRDEKTGECRLEMVFPAVKADEVAAALVEAHSYEEPAYDIYPLTTGKRDAGSGRVGELEADVSLADFAAFAAGALGFKETRYAGNPQMAVRRVAVVPGSGARNIPRAAAAADVLVTGDVKYSDLIMAREQGLAVVDAPHNLSETAALESWAPRLEKELAASGVKVYISETETGFWHTVSRMERKNISAAADNSLYHLHVDGGSRGNPGPAGIGAVLESPGGEVVETLSNFIGDATNNVAEYQALIAGVEMALDRGIRRLAIFSDSELVVRQLQGSYKVKNEGLKPFHQQAVSVLSELEAYEMTSIPRESNAHADELVNRAIENKG